MVRIQDVTLFGIMLMLNSGLSANTLESSSLENSGCWNPIKSRRYMTMLTQSHAMTVVQNATVGITLKECKTSLKYICICSEYVLLVSYTLNVPIPI